MKRLTLFFSISVSILGVSGCEKPVCCEPGPDPFLATVLTVENANYLKQYGDSVELYYFNGNSKKSLDIIINPYGDSSFLDGGNIAFLSMEGTKDFYLEAHGDIDTLYVDVNKNSKYESVAFNGKTAKTLKASIPGVPIYVLQK